METAILKYEALNKQVFYIGFKSIYPNLRKNLSCHSPLAYSLTARVGQLPSAALFGLHLQYGLIFVGYSHLHGLSIITAVSSNPPQQAMQIMTGQNNSVSSSKDDAATYS